MSGPFQRIDARPPDIEELHPGVVTAARLSSRPDRMQPVRRCRARVALSCDESAMRWWGAGSMLWWSAGAALRCGEGVA
ncbi:hypothetical protein [Nocardia blacklockiae]|uniref:hypothetical protein n=1 Tax=Nocardia blacklockiae TaxID=480036 RepID=UPI0018940925|nr:hypothetical protein [Nocardia blacklockiae]MBF6170311.1 hypothetical protein [Nocardia blacklockiae]